MSERQPDERDPIQKILKAGALYFALVFGAGFVLGTIRTLWIRPEFRYEKGGTDGGAHHVRGNRSLRALGGSPSRHIDLRSPGGFLSAWSGLASCFLPNSPLYFASEG